MFDNIINRLIDNGASAKKLDLVNKAYEIAKNNSSSDHYLRVAKIVSELNADEVMIIAALLHDGYAKGTISYDLIKEEFGEAIANLIDNLIKLRKIN